jgi:hypothetical protein
MLYLMKNRISCKPVMALVVMALCSQIAPVLLAQDSTPAPASAEAAAPASASETHPVQLSSGVSDILKLGSAHVSDEAITAFISNSGRTYHLSVPEILYLREQGMSDQVLTAMLTAGQNVAAAAVQAAPQPMPQPAPQPVPQPASTGPTADWVNSSPQPAPAPTQFAPTYDAAAPVYAQPAPVYTYPAPYYGYYDSWPYYSGYPALTLGFGFGGGYYGGYYGRGYYGGGYHGGGYHGGGFHGGGGGHR